MLKAIVIYDSYFGNTKQIAAAISEGIVGKGLDCSIRHASEIAEVSFEALELIVVGSPTQKFNPTSDAKKALGKLNRKAIAGKACAAYDTRIDLDAIDSRLLRFIVDKGGYAAKSIASKLKSLKGTLIAEPEGFYVVGEEGPLREGEPGRATRWGRELATRISEIKNPSAEKVWEL